MSNEWLPIVATLVLARVAALAQVVETSNGKASELGEAAVILGDANRVNTELAQIQAVTAEQVKAEVRRFWNAFTSAPRT